MQYGYFSSIEEAESFIKELKEKDYLTSIDKINREVAHEREISLYPELKTEADIFLESLFGDREPENIKEYMKSIVKEIQDKYSIVEIKKN